MTKYFLVRENFSFFHTVWLVSRNCCWNAQSGDFGNFPPLQFFSSNWFTVKLFSKKVNLTEFSLESVKSIFDDFTKFLCSLTLQETAAAIHSLVFTVLSRFPNKSNWFHVKSDGLHFDEIFHSNFEILSRISDCCSTFSSSLGAIDFLREITSAPHNWWRWGLF